jgi:hypothetical protein
MLKSFFNRFGRIFLKLALDAAVRKALPAIYKKLDLEMPRLLEEATPSQMTRAIGEVITEVTKGSVPVSQSQIEAVVGLYSPISAVVRNLKK